MERVEPTRGIVAKFWLAFVLRYAVCMLLIIVFQGFLMGMFATAMKATQAQSEAISTALSMLVGLPLALAASVECLYRIIGQRIGTFQLVLVRRD